MNDVKPPVIALDGPAASGKGTLNRLLATELGWNLLDSGAIYRSLGLLGADRGLKLEDTQGHLQLCGDLHPQFRIASNEVRVELGGRDRTEDVRTEEAGQRASVLAQHIELRNAILTLQRNYRQLPGLVADGRDMTTRIFPDACLCVFVTASPEIRAQRRALELQRRGYSVNISRLIDGIKERDQLDVQRHASPLRQSERARVLDTTHLTTIEMRDTVLDMWREKQ